MKKAILFLLSVVLGQGARAQLVIGTCGSFNANIPAINIGNLSNPTYSFNPGGVIYQAPYHTMSPAVNGNYTMYITGVDSQSAVVTQTIAFTVTISPAPLIMTSVAPPQCGSTSVVVTATPAGSAVNPANMVWSPTPVSLNTSTTAATYSLLLTPQIITVTVSDQVNCVASATAVIPALPPFPTFTINSVSGGYSVTCNTPTVYLNSTSSYTYNGGNLNYFWASPSTTFGTANVAITLPGNYTVTATDPISNCATTHTVAVGVNTLAPTGTVSPTLLNMPCGSANANFNLAMTPTVNVSQTIFSPYGGMYQEFTPLLIYTAGGPGTYTRCATNEINGCSTCQTFTVTSSQWFPTFSITSAQNFSLGCGTKSVMSVSIINAATTPTAGGPVSYSLLSPGTPWTIQTGTLTTLSVYTINTPGNYTFVTRDNTNLCDTRVPVTVIQNIFPPNLSASVPIRTLSCAVPQATLNASSTTPNASFLWTYPGGSVTTSAVLVSPNTAIPNGSVIGIYTLVITDPMNACISTTLIPMYQSIDTPTLSSNGPFNCPDPTLQIYPTITGNVSNITYSWSVVASAAVSGANTPTLTTNTVGIYTIVATNTVNSCFSSQQVTVEVCVGLTNKVNEQAAIHVFPNPGTGFYQVLCSDNQNASLEVYNATGALVLREAFSGNRQIIDIHNYPAGIYILKLKKNTGLFYCTRLIKE